MSISSGTSQWNFMRFMGCCKNNSTKSHQKCDTSDLKHLNIEILDKIGKYNVQCLDFLAIYEVKWGHLKVKYSTLKVLPRC